MASNSTATVCATRDASPLRITQWPWTTSYPFDSQRHARVNADGSGWWSASNMPTNSPRTWLMAALTFWAFELLPSTLSGTTRGSVRATARRSSSTLIGVGVLYATMICRSPG